MLKIGWFSTARGESSRKLLEKTADSILNGQLNARIEFVFCSRDPGESDKTDIFIDQVRAYTIPLVCFSIKEFANSHNQQIGVQDERLPEWRLEYDKQIILKLQKFSPDICVLAGYMLIVGNEICNRYRMINLHPALPTGPKGTWHEVIWKLIDDKAIESGVMMHLVTPDLDRGPVVTYCKYPITGPKFDNLWDDIKSNPASKIRSEQGENNELFKAIRQTGFIREIPLIIQTLKSLSEGKIKISDDRKILDNNDAELPGYDLTQEINIAIDSCHNNKIV